MTKWPNPTQSGTLCWYLQHSGTFIQSTIICMLRGCPDDSAGKESTCNAGDTGDAGLISRSGRSPGKANDNSLQYPCLENFMDRGAWQSVFQRVPFSSFRNYSCTLNVTLSSLRMTLFHLSSYLFPANTSLGKKVM